MRKNLQLVFFSVSLLFSFCCNIANAQKAGKARLDSLLAVLPNMRNDTLKVKTFAGIIY